MGGILTFKPKIQMIESPIQNVSGTTIKDEPMLFSSSWKFARHNGGPLTQYVMDMICEDVSHELLRHDDLGYSPVIDTKSVMLMPGFYPCIGGWHCDGVIRNDRNSQPDMSTLNENISHYVCNFTDVEDLSPTILINKDIAMGGIGKEHVWKSVNDTVEHCFKTKHVTENDLMYGHSGQIIKFNRETLHRGSKANKRGWRFFFRLSFYHREPRNEIRNQVQVYTDISNGW